ncbi:MAG: hypothetical protein RMI88_00990 [Nitrososphaerota archaeon]|nr:hypothetical protein [Nitrososphaerota archaeon]
MDNRIRFIKTVKMVSLDDDGTMLKQRFHEIWYVGKLDEDGVNTIVDQMSNVFIKVKDRVRLRFYLDNQNDLSYIASCRRILTENIALSIVIEDKPLDDLKKDIETVKDEVVLICNKFDLGEINNEKVRLVEV